VPQVNPIVKQGLQDAALALILEGKADTLIAEKLEVSRGAVGAYKKKSSNPAQTLQNPTQSLHKACKLAPCILSKGTAFRSLARKRKGTKGGRITRRLAKSASAAGDLQGMIIARAISPSFFALSSRGSVNRPLTAPNPQLTRS